MSQSFQLAPMSPLIQRLTIGLWILPALFVIAAILSRQWILLIPGLLMVVLYGAVWIWCRPLSFSIASDALKITFPGWQRRIPIQDFTHVRMIHPKPFRQEFGMAFRVGVGGLWGGFGWLWTSRQGWVEFYVSRTDGLV
jgi:hypothetical protein